MKFFQSNTVYPKKYAHGFCFAVLCCGYTLTDFPISIRLTSPALGQSNDCPSAGKATLMNMDKCFMWIHYERLHNHNKAKHNKTVCIFLGMYCTIERGKITVQTCVMYKTLRQEIDKKNRVIVFHLHSFFHNEGFHELTYWNSPLLTKFCQNPEHW